MEWIVFNQHEINSTKLKQSIINSIELNCNNLIIKVDWSCVNYFELNKLKSN